MHNTIVDVSTPTNETVRDYRPGSSERAALIHALEQGLRSEVEIPIVIAGKCIRSGDLAQCVCPHDHRHVLGHYHQANPEHVKDAISAALSARPSWSQMPWQHRLAIFRRAADMLATTHRDRLNAATMLGQSKSAHQAEIDSACELIDFLRFNVHFATQIMAQQPVSAEAVWNFVDYRPLEGFVLAVTPFNFTAIAGNLPTAPAMLGNVVLWKPAENATYAAYAVYQLLEEAGLPPGVINLLPGDGQSLVQAALDHPELAGVHFTGSTTVFRKIWRGVGDKIADYRGFPRIVGETGGKNFIFAHESADEAALVAAIVRGGYEFQGQKCSAASRVYLPQSLFRRIRDPLIDAVSTLPMGPPTDFRNFVCAVIDRRAFDKIGGYLKLARESPGIQVLTGGAADDSSGYFVQPTLLEVSDPRSTLMCEEVFGPLVAIYAYPDDAFSETLSLCGQTSPYGLTGAIFSGDRQAILEADAVLRDVVGNFYINDKPTGAVVGQQPFGGARSSGTNDKAGSALNLLRWVSPRTIKENLMPPTQHRYPYMD